MKKTMQDRVGDFMAGKGFYIVLLLCVAALGASGYYLFDSMTNEPGQAVSGTATVVVTPTPRPTPVPTPTVAIEPPATASPRPVQTAPPVPEVTPAPAETAPVTATASVFTWPVKGTVLREYNVEKLVYDETMGDWRTHSGLDIAALEGVNVLSISAGTVEQVYDDMLMGTTVVVSHGGGLQSWYCNLNEEVAVEAGDLVEIGGVLGTVGSTAIAEVGIGSHIHLETDLNGRPVDPRDYLS